MTWTRLDDGWTDRPIVEQLPYEVRWHYLALVQYCSRTGRYDGLVRATDARRCSDVPEPADALDQLVDVGLLVATEGFFKVVQIEEHVVPPHLRDEARRAAQAERKRRERQHRKGIHDDCLPDHCDQVSRPVTRDVTRDVGTGRDGTGFQEGDVTETGQESVTATEEASLWPTVAVPGRPPDGEGEPTRLVVAAVS